MSDRPSPTPHEIEQAAYRKLIPEDQQRAKEPDNSITVTSPEIGAPALGIVETPQEEERSSEPQKDTEQRGSYKTRASRQKPE